MEVAKQSVCNENILFLTFCCERTADLLVFGELVQCQWRRSIVDKVAQLEIKVNRRNFLSSCLQEMCVQLKCAQKLNQIVKYVFGPVS